jgi:hypothetical protein
MKPGRGREDPHGKPLSEPSRLGEYVARERDCAVPLDGKAGTSPHGLIDLFYPPANGALPSNRQWASSRPVGAAS